MYDGNIFSINHLHRQECGEMHARVVAGHSQKRTLLYRRSIWSIYSRAMEFEWYEPKRQSNLARHKIDFQDAKEIWHGNVLAVPSAQTQHGEQRSIAYGVVAG